MTISSKILKTSAVALMISCSAAYIQQSYASNISVNSENKRNIAATPSQEASALTLVGDLNGDNIVNTEDMTLLLSVWGPVVPGKNDFADLNQDGTVGMNDLSVILAYFGQKGSEEPEPENAELLTHIQLINNGNVFEDDIVLQANGEGQVVINGFGGSNVNLTFNYISLHNNAEEPLRIEGITKVENLEDHEVTVKITHTMPVCGSIANESQTGGSLNAALVVNEDGGFLACADASNSLSKALIDGVTVSHQFACPFVLQGSGSSILNTSDYYGLPIPSLPAPGVNDSIGIRHELKITSGELTSLSATHVVDATNNANIEACE